MKPVIETYSGQSRAGYRMTTTLQAITDKSQTHPQHHFQNLSCLLDEDLLYESWKQLNKSAAPGIDNIDAEKYAEQLSGNLSTLKDKLRTGDYRCAPIKRVYIPKLNSGKRPLGLPILEDKIVQQSVSQILQSIWEADFLPNSYGYRPNKSAHGAVHSLCLNLQYKGYGYIVEADIKGFFNNLSHAWLKRMLEQRIGDKRLIRLIQQWMRAKVIEPDGTKIKPLKGTPQGGVVSPVLANIYLHYVLDIWFEKVVKPKLKGKAMLIRYADDFVLAFQLQQDASNFYKVLPQRLEKFGLSVAPDKTRLIRFSRFHPGRQRCFVFLGFEYYWSRDRNRKPRLRRRTSRKKQHLSMKVLYDWIKRNRSKPINEFMKTLKRKLQGFCNYYGLPDNSGSLHIMYGHVIRSAYKWLNRRSQRRSYNWKGFKDMLNWFGIRPMKVWKRTHVIVDWF